MTANSSTTIYILRHGHVHNPQQVLYGHMPGFHLSEKGKREVQVSADYLHDKGISAVYSSPLLRARQSARIISNTLKISKVSIRAKLTESHTHFQGSPYSEVNAISFDFYSDNHRIETDETLTQITDRMTKQIFAITAEHPEQTIVCVSHGDPILVLYLVMNGKPVTPVSVRPATKGFSHTAEIFKISLNGSHYSMESVFLPASV